MANEVPANFSAIVDKLMTWGRSGLIPETKIIKSYWPPIADPTTGVQVCLPATVYSTEDKTETVQAEDPFWGDKKIYTYNVVKNRYGDVDNIGNSPGASDVIQDNCPQQPSVPAVVPDSSTAASTINFANLYLEAIKKSNTQAEYEENIKRFKSPGAVERLFEDFGPDHFNTMAEGPTIPAKPVRTYYYAESTSLLQTIQTTDKNKLNLTFTPQANSRYVYIWSADIGVGSPTIDTRANLKNNAGTNLCSTNIAYKDASDVITVSGIAFESFGAAPTSQTLTLNFSTENSAAIARISNARLVAIELKDSDIYVEDITTQTTSSTSLQTAATLNFTPSTVGDYLIIGSCEFNINNTINGFINLQLTHDSSAYNVATGMCVDTSNFPSGFMQAYLPSLPASNQTVTLDFSTVNAAHIASVRNTRILALKLDDFADHDVQTDSTVTSISSTTYRDKLSNSEVLDNQKRLVICSSIIGYAESTSIGNLYRLAISNNAINEMQQENKGVSLQAYPYQPLFGSFFLQSERQNNSTVSYQFKKETTGSGNARTGYVTLATLALTPLDTSNRYNKRLQMPKIFDKLEDAKSFLNDISVKPVNTTSRVIRPKENYEMYSTKVPCAVPGVLNCYIGVYDNITGRKT